MLCSNPLNSSRGASKCTRIYKYIIWNFSARDTWSPASSSFHCPHFGRYLAAEHYLETLLLKQKHLPSNIAVPVHIQHETMQIQQFLKMLPPTSLKDEEKVYFVQRDTTTLFLYHTAQALHQICTMVGTILNNLLFLYLLSFSCSAAQICTRLRGVSSPQSNCGDLAPFSASSKSIPQKTQG